VCSASSASGGSGRARIGRSAQSGEWRDEVCGSRAFESSRFEAAPTSEPREGYTRRVLWAWIWIVFALLVNGLIFRWLGGFVGAGQAVERWGEGSAKRWARRRGMKGF
jgi:hypothetical protein